MLLNYLKIAFRSLMKFRGYTLVNLSGLSLGLAVGLLIMLDVTDELSYDNFHVYADRVYRVTTVLTNTQSGSESGALDTNGWPVGAMLKKDYPEVEAVWYARSADGLQVNHGDKRESRNIHFSSPELFQLFSFPLIKGNPTQALQQPYSIVLNETLAQYYFPGQDPLNKTLMLADTLACLVTGVMQDIPAQSHIQADMFLSWATYEALDKDFTTLDGWGNINVHNYVLLKAGANAETLITKAQSLYDRYAGEQMKSWGVKATLGFEPLPDIYLKSTTGNGMGPKGSIDRVYLVLAIGGFVILLACINFVNLTTARSVYRSREVGLRKVVGSSRGALIRQFMGESLLITVMSLFFALVLTGMAMPVFNAMMQKHYTLSSLVNPQIVCGMVVLVIIVTLLSGYYPARILSSMRPAEVLKGRWQHSEQGIQLRRALVIFQFMISVTLLMGTWTVLQQLDYMQQQSLGFTPEQVLVINAGRAKGPQSTFETFHHALRQLPGVSHVSYTNSVPGAHGWQGQIAYPDGKSGESAVSVEYIAADDQYIQTLGLSLVAGRSFDVQRAADMADGLVINETAVSSFGWQSPEDAIGKRITSPSGHPAGEVIGVVKDYHQQGLQQAIGAITIDYAPGNSYLYAIRYKSTDTKALLSATTALWQRHFHEDVFDYFFLDESFGRQYASEEKLARVFGWFAGITMVIAVIGLLGLVSFMVTARTKEIGVRKVLGASVWRISFLLTREFMILVLVANLLAWPLVWVIGEQWLQNFAVHTSLSAWSFALTLIMALLVTGCTIGIQTLKAAMADPVKSLRYE